MAASPSCLLVCLLSNHNNTASVQEHGRPIHLGALVRHASGRSQPHLRAWPFRYLWGGSSVPIVLPRNAMSRTGSTTSSRRGTISGSGGSSSDTVGLLLGGIATALSNGLRILHFADKRGWGPDEFEQVRALDETLDEAKADFQTMAPLVNGQFFYESDRTSKSLEELRILRAEFEAHSQLFKDWLRTGGPINPEWVLKTVELRRDLHRAQCRAACRIYATAPGPTRCLGAFQVSRHQRQMDKRRAVGNVAEAESMLRIAGDAETGVGLEPQVVTSPDGDERWRHDNAAALNDVMVEDGENNSSNSKRDDLETLVPFCNKVGKFERFGDRDIAFACDYCDGFLVWEDLDRMPATRTPNPSTTHPHILPTSSVATAIPAALVNRNQQEWEAKARTISSGEETTIVFAPVAIANHLLPGLGDWRARLLCPYCDEYTYVGEDGDDGGETRYAQDERGFPDVKTFREHLEWYHAGGVVPMPTAPTKKENCIVM